MSTPLGTTPSRDQGRALPTGETIGRYTSYLDAQKAVDYLADNKFAVQKVAIIGSELKMVERVTGRLSYPRVALSSAATGAWFGLFVGLILSLFGGSEMASTILSSIALGAIFWLLFGVITYAFQRGKRDFTSTSQVVASSYDIIVEPSLANEARRMLQQLPMNGQAQHPGAGQTAWGSGQGQAPQQPAPERPASWNDPYGSQRPEQQNEQQNQQQNQQATEDRAITEAETAGLGTTGPRRGQLPDLPDGRPQYGVRVAEQSAADRQAPQPGGDAAPGAGPAGGPSTTDAQQEGEAENRSGSSSAGGQQQ